MITAVEAAELLGRQVVINDGVLQGVNVRLMTVRVHPDLPLDYVVDVDSGHAYQGSALITLEQWTAEWQPPQEELPPPIVMPGQ